MHVFMRVQEIRSTRNISPELERRNENGTQKCWFQGRQTSEVILIHPCSNRTFDTSQIYTGKWGWGGYIADSP